MRLRSVFRLSFLLGLLVASGCYSSVRVEESTDGAVRDAASDGGGSDGAAADAATPDASGVDASSSDASAVDASGLDGSTSDAAVADASMDGGMLDAATGASTTDASVADAAMDAGVADGSVVDAAVPTSCPMSASPHRLFLSYEFACAIGNDCQLACWGVNGTGQLGVGDTDPRNTPTHVSGGPWLEVDGINTTGSGPFNEGGSVCALDYAGRLFCWGFDSNVSPLYSTMPVLRSSGPFAHVGGGAQTTNAIGADGSLFGFGRNQRGAVGTGGDPATYCVSPTDPTGWIPIGGRTGFTDLFTAVTSRCALHAGELECWGSNRLGQIAPGTTVDQCQPVRVGAESDWTWVSPSDALCGIRNGGELYCWGRNLHGVADPDDSATVVDAPRRLMAGSRFLQVSSDFGLACAVREDHALFCWGRYSDYFLWTPTSATIAQVGQGHEWAYVKVSTNTARICAVTTSDELYCWGWAADGFLGNLGVQYTRTPQRIALP